MKKINPERNWRSSTKGFSGVWERNPWITSQRSDTQFGKIGADAPAQSGELVKPQKAVLIGWAQDSGIAAMPE
jgi:hypothetical protein